MTQSDKIATFHKFNAKQYNRLNKNNDKLTKSGKYDEVGKILVNLRWQSVNYLDDIAPELSSQSMEMFFTLAEKYGVVLTEPKKATDKK